MTDPLVGVRCIRECHYSFRAMYSPITDVSFGGRQQVRLDGHSANVYKLTIPSTSTDDTGITNSAVIKVAGEDPYDLVEAFISLDSDLNQIEDYYQQVTVDSGKGFRLYNGMTGWCTDCAIYLVMVVEKPNRYYIDSVALRRDEYLQANVADTKVVSALQQTCF